MPRSAREHGYSRRHRFSERGSFGPVLRSAKKVRGESIVVHAVPGSEGASRLGVALTRRFVPSAVERNRVKRVVREAFRRHPLKRSGLDCVVALRRRVDEASLQMLRDEVVRLFDALHESATR